MNERNQTEFRGFIDLTAPRSELVKEKGYLATTGELVKVSLHSGLPFLNIYAYTGAVGSTVSWRIEGQVLVYWRGRVVQRYPIDSGDASSILHNEPLLSAFVSGTGSPSKDMMILNTSWTGTAGVVGLVPKRITAVADEIRIQITKLHGTAGVRGFLAVEQTNIP